MILNGIAAGLRAAGIEPDPRQILDVLFLATLLPPNGEVRGAVAGAPAVPPPRPVPRVEPPAPMAAQLLLTPPGSDEVTPVDGLATDPPWPRTAPALDNPLGIGRALRPLRVRRPAARRTVLDEVATAERFARLDYWMPVLRASQVRWPDLALVADCSPSIWASRFQRLELVLQRLGAFRQQRTWRLHPRSVLGGQPVAAPGLTGQDGPDRDAKLLAEPSGRRLLLIVTDGTSPEWNGAYRNLLKHWARTNPVGIISLVSPRLWPTGGLNATAGAVRSAYPLQPNQNWDKCWRDASRGPAASSLGPVLPIPVADLHPRRLAQLAATLGGSQHWARSLLLDIDSCEPAPTDWADRGPVEAVALARARLRPRAFELLVYLSVAPLVLGPLTDRARQVTMPEATDDEFAELLSSGLIEPVRRPDGHHEVIGYRFRDPKVREELGYRLNPSLRMRTWWELFVFAQDKLGLDRDAARLLMDRPDELDRRPRQRDFALAAGPIVAVVRDTAKLDAGLLAVASLAPARREAWVHDLALRWVDAGRLDNPRVVFADARMFATGGLTMDEALADAAGGVLALDSPDALRDNANPRCKQAVRVLLKVSDPQRGCPVALCGSEGQIDGLLGVYPSLRGRVTVHRLRTSPADDAYLILRGYLRGDGLNWSRGTEREAWAHMVRRYNAERSRFSCDDVAREVYQVLVARWRARSGRGGERVVEHEDVLSVAR